MQTESTSQMPSLSSIDDVIAVLERVEQHETKKELRKALLLKRIALGLSAFIFFAIAAYIFPIH